MDNGKARCIIILSDKSSGSSIVQKELLKSPDINVLKKTRHYENESLYWIKCAAILNLQQPQIYYSEVPIDKEIAENDILKLFKDNIGNYSFKNKPFSIDYLMEGWYELSKEFGPVFLEKSPHHLHSITSLGLMVKCYKNYYKNIDFKFIGLIRNPMDVLYSMWKRWSALPEFTQYDWLRAYKNLEAFKKIVKEKMIILSYEDIVSGRMKFKNICEFLNIKYTNEIGNNIHKKSINKWKNDNLYGFKLSKKVLKFSNRYYQQDDLINNKIFTGEYYRKIVSKYINLEQKIKHLARKIR